MHNFNWPQLHLRSLICDMSFRRRTVPQRASLPVGVTEAACGARVVSSGVKGLDALLGGGLALGRLTVIIEDGVTKLHAHVLSSVASTARSHSHALAVALPTSPAKQFIASLDKASPNLGLPEQMNANPQLSIAWRYAPVKSTLPTASYKSAPVSGSTSAHLTRVSTLGFPDVSISSLLSAVTAHCERAKTDNVISVVVVASVGMLWNDNGKLIDFHSVLLKLRELARRIRTSAILLTLPSSTLAADAALSADTVIQLNALPPEERKSRAPDGVAVLEKAPHIAPGVWLGKRGEVYTYRASRRGIVLEPATVEPEEEDGEAAAETGCGSSTGGGGGGGDTVGGIDF